jgi:hypothetical protein
MSVSNLCIVKVAILPHNTNQEAQRVYREFIAHAGPTESLPDIGDEAHTWGGVNKYVIFRKRNFTVYISIVTDDITNAAELHKDFARLVAQALHAL